MTVDFEVPSEKMLCFVAITSRQVAQSDGLSQPRWQWLPPGVVLPDTGPTFSSGYMNMSSTQKKQNSPN